ESDAASVQSNAFVRSSISYFSTSRKWAINDNIISGVDTGIAIGSTSPGGQITNNTFVNNNLGINLTVGNIAEADGTAISGNTFVNNGAAGVLVNAGAVSGTPSVRITNNVFKHNGFTPAGRTDRLSRAVHDGLHTAVAAGSQVVIASNVTVANA